MTEKKLWTKEQDDILRHLKEEQGILKWSEIARRMKLKFGKNSRNQKQCRDRYINHLRVNKEDFEWKKVDQDKMIQLHRQYGNKWAAIAQNFTGITQNFIKNQFYSRLRKSIRKLNKYISESFRREFKEFKLNLIFKLASIVDGKLKKINDIHPELNAAYGKFLYLLISYSSEEMMDQLQQVSMEDQFVQRLVRPLVTLEQIFYYFNKKNKRKAKQIKVSSLRFNQQMQANEVQGFQIQNELNTKIQKISQKAMLQLKQLMDFEAKYMNLGRGDVKQQKLQQQSTNRNFEGFKSKNGQKNSNKIAVSQNSLQLGQLSETSKLTEQKLKCFKQPLQDYFKPIENISSYIEEESEIMDILYEQSPRSVSFILDQWRNSEMSQQSAHWDN